MNNIPEYYQYEAERCDNGKIIVGYLAHDEFCNTSIPYIGFASYDSNDWVEVKSETICRVAVKPILLETYMNGACKIKNYKCPNCSCAYNAFGQAYEYCPHCGQHLDWSDEDDTARD